MRYLPVTKKMLDYPAWQMKKSGEKLTGRPVHSTMVGTQD